MQYQVSFGASKITTNSSFATLNPALSSDISVTITQPLIRNRGNYVNRLNLMMARGRLKGAEYTLRANLLAAVNTAENAYWDVVQARENLRVQESARKLADESLKLSEKQLNWHHRRRSISTIPSSSWPRPSWECHRRVTRWNWSRTRCAGRWVWIWTLLPVSCPLR